MSDKPDEIWHEAPSVTIARLVCQMLVTLLVLGAGLVLVLSRPEYNSGVALVCGVVLGAWFVLPLNMQRRRRRREPDD